MKTRTIIDSVTGKSLPVTCDLKLSPLKYMGEVVVSRSGDTKMDDEWIYVNMPNYGLMSINVNRANYARKIYLENVKIQDSIGFAKVSKRLQAFLSEVSDTIVFTKNGCAYRVYLTFNKEKKEYDISHVWPYWATVSTGGISPAWVSSIKKYGGHPGWDYKILPDGSKGAHRLDVDLKNTFGFDYE